MLILLMCLLMSMLDVYALMILMLLLVLLTVIASNSIVVSSKKYVITVVEASGIERCHMCLDTPLSMLSILLVNYATILLMTCYTDVTFVTLCIVVIVLLSSVINSQTSVCIDSVCDIVDSDDDIDIIADAYSVMIPMVSTVSMFVVCMINIFIACCVDVLTWMRGGSVVYADMASGFEMSTSHLHTIFSKQSLHNTGWIHWKQLVYVSVASITHN